VIQHALHIRNSRCILHSEPQHRAGLFQHICPQHQPTRTNTCLPAYDEVPSCIRTCLHSHWAAHWLGRRRPFPGQVSAPLSSCSIASPQATIGPIVTAHWTHRHRATLPCCPLVLSPFVASPGRSSHCRRRVHPRRDRRGELLWAPGAIRQLSGVCATLRQRRTALATRPRRVPPHSSLQGNGGEFQRLTATAQPPLVSVRLVSAPGIVASPSWLVLVGCRVVLLPPPPAPAVPTSQP
jgi:hypothetical protein